jgi:hypothetical protein
MAQFPTKEGDGSASGIWKLKDVWIAIRGDNWLIDLSGDRGLFAGGALSPGYSNVIDYISIATTGNATDFGDLATAVYGANNGAVGSTTRALFAGGGDGTGDGINEISYVTIASTGNATDFGDLTVSGRAMGAGISSSTRGIFGPRRHTPSPTPHNDDVIDYVTIASAGDATDFGDATVAAANNAGASSSTRGIKAGGNSNTPVAGVNVIDYLTIASTGDATDFGDLLAVKYDHSGCSSSTRALFGGNSTTSSDVIEYITIASVGNAVDFGDLSTASSSKAVSNTVRGVFSEDQGSPSVGNTTYVNISSTGDVSTFGDLSVARYAPGTGSNAHGGIQ